MRKIKIFLGKIKIWIADHYHILFKSAAVNHLRIQELLKNPDGTYQLTVKFNSYSELKDYQKKVRRLTVSLSSAVAMVIVAFIVAPYIMNPNRSSAAMFSWNQSNWSGAVASTGTTDKTTWTGISYKDTNVNVAAPSSSDHPANSVSLTLPAASTTGYTDFNGVTADGFYVDSTTKALTLKKVANATCGSSEECKSGLCRSGTCSQNLALGATCSISNDCASNFCNVTAPKTCQADPWGGRNYILSAGTMKSYAVAQNICIDLGGQIPGAGDLTTYSLPQQIWYNASGCSQYYLPVYGFGCQSVASYWNVSCVR